MLLFQGYIQQSKSSVHSQTIVLIDSLYRNSVLSTIICHGIHMWFFKVSVVD